MSAPEYIAAWSNGCANFNEVIGLIEVASLIEDEKQFTEISRGITSSPAALKTLKESMQFTVKQAIDKQTYRKPACSYPDENGANVDITWESLLLIQVRFCYEIFVSTIGRSKKPVAVALEFFGIIRLLSQYGNSREIRSLSQCVLQGIKGTLIAPCSRNHSIEAVNDKGFGSMAANFSTISQPQPQISQRNQPIAPLSNNLRPNQQMQNSVEQNKRPPSVSTNHQQNRYDAPPPRTTQHSRESSLTDHASLRHDRTNDRVESHSRDQRSNSYDRSDSHNSNRMNNESHSRDRRSTSSNSYDRGDHQNPDRRVESHSRDQRTNSSDRTDNQRFDDRTSSHSNSSRDRDPPFDRSSQRSHERDPSHSGHTQSHTSTRSDQSSHSRNRSSSPSGDHRPDKVVPFAILPDRQHAESRMQPCFFYQLCECFVSKCAFVHAPYLECFQECAQNVAISGQQIQTLMNDFTFAPRWRLVDSQGSHVAAQYEMLLPFPAREIALMNFRSKELSDFVHAIIGRSQPFVIKGSVLPDRPSRTDARWARMLARARLDDLTRLQQGIAFLIDRGFCSANPSVRMKLIERAEQRLD